MATKYELVREADHGRERFHAQPSTGFDSATAAAIYATDMGLDGAWFIQTVAPDAQPARFEGIQ